MPITLSKIAANTAKIAVMFGEDTINLSYYPGRITEKVFSDLETFSEMSTSGNIKSGFESLNEILIYLIKEWDIFEDDAQTVMYPLDAERLKELPVPLRTDILFAIIGDFRPEAPGA